MIALSRDKELAMLLLDPVQCKIGVHGNVFKLHSHHYGVSQKGGVESTLMSIHCDKCRFTCYAQHCHTFQQRQVILGGIAL